MSVTTVRDEIRERLDLNPPTFDYEPELWPGYKGSMLTGSSEWRLAMFGLVPYFSKDGKDFRRTYNARSELRTSNRPTEDLAKTPVCLGPDGLLLRTEF